MTKIKKNNPFLGYPTAPLIYQAEKAFKQATLKLQGKNILFRPPKADVKVLGFKKKLIRPYNLYLSLSQEMEGLNEALEDAEAGRGLRRVFDPEWEKFRQLREINKEHLYGVYVFYPAKGDLVQFAPEYLHRLNLVTSNATLYQDPEYKMGWDKVREIYDDLVIAVAGGSVGNNIARMIAKDIRPKQIKVADQRLYKWANANRVDLFYDDLVWPQELIGKDFAPTGLKNKAISTAQQIHKTDPFIKIWAYFLGINSESIESFINGNKTEPKADIVVDEMDSLEMKFLIAENCRKSKTILIRGTDAGSVAQIDILRFDKYPDLSLAAGISDENLYQALGKYRDDKSKKNFFTVADMLLGKEHKAGEFARIINDKTPNMFTSIPQLGSTAALTAALVTEVAARIPLGFKYPQRFIVDKKNLELKVFYNEKGVKA